MDFLIKATAVVAPILAICIFAVPSYLGVLKQKRFFAGLFIIILLSAYAFGVYTVAAKTGLLGGNFSFNSTLGYKLFNTTPWVLAFAYPPILLVAFWLASKFTHKFFRVILTAIFAAFVNVILDPATVKLELWKWENPGSFYGVPPIIFASWFVIGLIGAWLLHLLWGKQLAVKSSVAYSGIVVVLFWAGVNAGVDQWIPFGAGMLGGLILAIVLIVEKHQLKDSK